METRNRLRTLHMRLLDRNGLRRADISCYLSQNLSLAAFRASEEALDVTIAKPCADNLTRYGHLGPHDVFFNLADAIDQGHLTAGDRAVLINASPSAAWSALLVELGHEQGSAHHL